MTETDERPDVILHEPGECPDTGYGANCDGIGHWQENPFGAEVYDDFTKSYICDGVAHGAAMDI